MTFGDGDRRRGVTLPEPVNHRQLEDAGVANMVLVSRTDVKGQTNWEKRQRQWECSQGRLETKEDGGWLHG